MNCRAKGRRIENQAADILRSDGWLVEQVPLGNSWTKHRDFFGLFDIIAIKGKMILLVQVKTRKCPSEAFVDFKTQHPNIQVELWVKKDRQEFKRYEAQDVLESREWQLLTGRA